MYTFFRCVALALMLIVCSSISTIAAESRTFTLEQAVLQAMQANPGVEAKLLMLENARLNVGVAQSYFWPRVSLVASVNRIEN